MKVLIDINHPAHVHFFSQPVRMLQTRGHDVLITSRDKEFTLELLERAGFSHTALSSQGGKGLLSLGTELIKRDYALHRVATRFKPDVMAAIGGTFVAHVGALSRVPALVFYDTENAVLQNAITYPFASCVIVPRCYDAWVPRRRHIRYNGYHELSYLHPHYFKPDRNAAVANGLAKEGDTFVVRLVSWRASHDIGERGWSMELLGKLMERLSPAGKVLISSEAPLPERYSKYAFRGDPAQMHHVLAFARACIGESATMASECAVLGVPAVYAAETGRGYTDEQESRYGLVANIRRLDWEDLGNAIERVVKPPRERWEDARRRLLEDTIDVAAFVVECIETFPAPLHAYHSAEAM